MEVWSLALLLLAGLFLGYLAAWFALAGRRKAAAELEMSKAEAERACRDAQVSSAQAQERARYLQEALDESRTEASGLSQQKVQAESDLAVERERNRALGEQLQEGQARLDTLEARMKESFQNLAGSLLEESRKKLSELGEKRMVELLDPIRNHITEFKKKVEDVHETDIRDRVDLRKDIQRLTEMNQNLAQGADELARALRGDSKAQGNWGELALERLLEGSGLTEGRDYELQKTFQSEEERRLRPDAVILLPGNRSVFVDAKVSLTAYAEFTSAVTDPEREEALKRHLASVRGHIKELAEKRYQDLSGRAPEFVILFVPIEPALSAAVHMDETLVADAHARHIALVSPATLFVALHIVADLWALERQNKNALEIARQAGALYDKFHGFLSSFTSVGAALDSARKEYDAALGQLSTGKGNLLKRAQDIRNLGAKASKNLTDLKGLPANTVDAAVDEGEE